MLLAAVNDIGRWGLYKKLCQSYFKMIYLSVGSGSELYRILTILRDIYDYLAIKYWAELYYKTFALISSFVFYNTQTAWYFYTRYFL